MVGATGLVVGLILAIQSRPALARFGAESYVPAMVSISVVRELGPILTALMVAGRVGSGISAELGSMRVTEQIDAIEVSGTDSFKFLIVTRVLACTLLLPLLAAIVNVLAILGAYIPSATEMHMSWS
jgi:phospholipid/cholesterol/gamma-HCH transport system permease protein